MGETTAISCAHCKRPNNATAARCLWCGAPFRGHTASPDSPLFQLTLEYLGGLARLDIPCPVRIVISPSGVEIQEMMPGSRAARIESHAIAEAAVLGRDTARRFNTEGSGVVATLRRLFGKRGQMTPAWQFCIRYEESGRPCEAIFQKEGAQALSQLRTAARIINEIRKPEQQGARHLADLPL